MVLYKPISSFDEEHTLEIMTETGHIIEFKIIPRVLIDIEGEDNGQPFFSVSFEHIYQGVKELNKKYSLKEIKEKYKNTNLLTKEMDYDHIQIGFVYSEGDPNNHKWMINFMDVNNKLLFNYSGLSLKINCPFTTMSWGDGIWHGRIVISKNDIKELLEPNEGEFIINGSGNIGDQKIQEIKEEYDNLSLSYNIHTNTWHCDYLLKGEKVGTTLCKNIICDVPFEGKIDRSSSKPKVSAILKKENIAGISIALNALIIKAK